MNWPLTNEAYITASEVCVLFKKLAALNLGMPITMFLDNARYQKCELVRATAEHLHIELCFFASVFAQFEYN